MGWKGAGMVAAGGRRSWFRLAALMLLLVLCWLGSVIPLPGLNQEAVASLFGPYGHGMLRQLSIFALGLGSLLTALAYLEIAKLLFPVLARWQGASADNMFRLNDYVRLAAVAIALFQAYGVAVALQQGPYLVAESQGGFVLVAIATLLGGCALLWWLVDRITLLGFGNGFWLAWVAGIVSGFPRDIVQLADLTRTGWVGTDIWLILAGFLLAICLAAVIVNALLVDQTSADIGPPTASNRETTLAARAASLALIWPPLLANIILGYAVWLLRAFGLSTEAVYAWMGYGRPARLLLLALLLPLFCFAYMRTWLRDGAQAGFVIRPRLVFWMLCALQIISCLGGEWLERHLKLPFSLHGASLILCTTVAMRFLRGLSFGTFSSMPKTVATGPE